ncbi:MAG TPA: hypothetical protein VGD68_16655 [Streptosporangiaceae bacterium]
MTGAEDRSSEAPRGAPGNSGISITGGSFSGAAFAAGAHARAHQISHAPDDSALLARIDHLLRQLEDGATELEADDAEAVADDVERVRAEIRQRKPEPDTLSRLLGRLTTRVSSAAALLTAVDQVKELITSLLH